MFSKNGWNGRIAEEKGEFDLAGHCYLESNPGDVSGNTGLRDDNVFYIFGRVVEVKVRTLQRIAVEQAGGEVATAYAPI